MRIIAESECLQWVAENIGITSGPDALKTKYDNCVTYELPTDTGSKTALARILSRAGGRDTTRTVLDHRMGDMAFGGEHGPLRCVPMVVGGAASGLCCPWRSQISIAIEASK